MVRRTVLAPLLVATIAAPAPGCFWLEGFGNAPILGGDDVRIDLPGSGFRASKEYGEVHEMAFDAATDINRWVAEIAGELGEAIAELEAQPTDDRDGRFRVYGPYDDEDGDDVSWMAKIDGDETRVEFQILVGDRGARERDMVVLLSGELQDDDGVREGSFSVDFDVIWELPALRKQADAEESFGGLIEVSFSRDTETREKTVDLAFDGFWYENDEESLSFDGETYAYRRTSGGAGSFHLATWAPLDEEGWSGPELERVAIDMVWTDDEAGRARAVVTEEEGQGDLRHGDLTVHECFDAASEITWRAINDEYVDDAPDYGFGKESSCVLDESDLDRAVD